MKSLGLLCLLMLLVFPMSAGSQVMSNRLSAPARQLVALKMQAEAIDPEVDAEAAARAELDLARLYRNLGMRREEQRALLRAGAAAAGTELERGVRVERHLQMGRMQLHREAGLGAWAALLNAVRHTRSIEAGEPKRHLELEAEALRFEILLRTADAVAQLPDDYPVEKLDPDQRQLLAAIFSGQGVVALPSSSVELATLLHSKRPWLKVLSERLERTLEAHGELVEASTALSTRRHRALGFRNRAMFLARVGESAAAHSSFLLSIEQLGALGYARDAALATQELCGLFDETAHVKFLKAAFDVCFSLVQDVEFLSLGLGGVGLTSLLQEYRAAYTRFYEVLTARFRTSDVVPILLQADRMNFRGVRRDLDIYREFSDLSDADPALIQRFHEQETVLLEERQRRDDAFSAGLDPEALGSSADSNPFLAYEDAKQDLVAALEDVKRVRITERSKLELFSMAPFSRFGQMEGDQAMVLYYLSPSDSTLHAAVITAGEVEERGESAPRVRIVSFDGVTERDVALQVAHVRDLFAAGLDASDELRAISQRIWQPLGALPARVTVLLVPPLIGMPFAALPGQDGKPAASEHSIRYAFGLQDGIESYPTIDTLKRAIVFGAESFGDSSLPPLASSRREVESIRSLLSEQGIEVSPQEALPRDPQGLLSEGGRLDVIHISTHSRLDPTVPLLDSLLFPSGEVFAHQLARSSLRSELVVLSACELFTSRHHGLYPVSGLTTVALAAVAPQVLSTLWSVDEFVTMLFMRRFYGHLLELREPSAALAQTNRDFIEAGPTSSWLDAVAPGTSPEQVSALAEPASWAPFVIVVGASATGDGLD